MPTKAFSIHGHFYQPPREDPLTGIIPQEPGAAPHNNWNERILETINTDTAFVVMASVHWMNGTMFDLESIGDRCREVGAKLIVDGYIPMVW